MSITRTRLGSLLVAALVLGVLVAMGWGHSQAGPSHAQTPDGAMAVDCDVSQAGVQSDCTYAPGSTFSVQINATEAPSIGFATFQVYFQWDSEVVSYPPDVAAPTTAADEALWDSCTIPARSPEPLTGDPPVLFACVSFPLASFMDTGPLAEFEFVCSGAPNASSPPAGLDADQTIITLIPSSPNPPPPAGFGSYFSDTINNEIATALSNATIRCGEVPIPTPGGPTDTPTTGATGGVVPTSLPVTGTSLLDSDGGVNGGLWIAIGVLFAAAAAALTGVAWKRARAH